MNNNPTCVVRCPAHGIIRTISQSRYGIEAEIDFQLYKAKRKKENRASKPVIKPWSSYPIRRGGRPLDAEETDGESLLGEMEWFDGSHYGE